jgi:DHA1 family multidrug resistance protein-like MFS transporter
MGPFHSSDPTEVDLESGRESKARRSSNSLSAFDDVEDGNIEIYDGHRPCGRELYESISRSRTCGRRHSQHTAAIGTTTGNDQSLHQALSPNEIVLSRIRARPEVAPFTHPLAHQETTVDAIVGLEGEADPYRPMNWPTTKKVTTTAVYGLTTMTATWASASLSAGTRQVAKEFHVGSQVAVLGTTLFLFGFGLGPLQWAPVSEVYGRKLAVLAPMFVAACMSSGSATSKDIQTLMLTRFLGAFFASAPVTNTGGVLGDLFDPAWRALAMSGYAMAVVSGTCLGKVEFFSPCFSSISSTTLTFSLGPIVSAAFVANPSLGGVGPNTLPASFKALFS